MYFSKLCTSNDLYALTTDKQQWILEFNEDIQQ